MKIWSDEHNPLLPVFPTGESARRRRRTSLAKPPRVTRAACITVARPAVHARYVLPDRTLFAVRTAYMGTTANDLWWSRRGLLSRVDCPPSTLCTGTFEAHRARVEAMEVPMDEGANAHTPGPYLDDGEHRRVQSGAAHRPQSLATLQPLDVLSHRMPSRPVRRCMSPVIWAACFSRVSQARPTTRPQAHVSLACPPSGAHSPSTR